MTFLLIWSERDWQLLVCEIFCHLVTLDRGKIEGGAFKSTVADMEDKRWKYMMRIACEGKNDKYTVLSSPDYHRNASHEMTIIIFPLIAWNYLIKYFIKNFQYLAFTIKIRKSCFQIQIKKYFFNFVVLKIFIVRFFQGKLLQVVK